MGNTFPTMMAALEPCHVAFEVGRGAASGVRLSGFAGRLERVGSVPAVWDQSEDWIQVAETRRGAGGVSFGSLASARPESEADGGGCRDQDRLASGRASGLGGAQTASPVERRRRGGLAGALDD